MPVTEPQTQARVRRMPDASAGASAAPASDEQAGLPPEHRRDYIPLFVFGCPRSGTTWMQLLLAQHPAIATAPESQIFAYYLDHFLRQWRHEHETARAQGKAGLSRVLSEAEFEGLCRANALIVLDRIAANNPGARIVVEKSPRHALQAAFIRRVLPHARFLHVIRDPRDTAASLLAASRTWARWAPRNPIDAARLWTAHITAARATGGSPLYREIKYEALTRNTAEELHGILQWLGAPLDAAECERIARACAIDKLKKVEHGKDLPIPGERSPRDFFRKGVAGGWTQDLTRRQVEIIELVCGDLMRETGYEPATTGRAVARWRVRAHDALARVRDAVDWQLQKLLWKV